MTSQEQQLTIDGRAVPVETVGGRECAAAAHDPRAARLFEPAPAQIAGQSCMVLDSADSAGCTATSS